MKRLSVLVLLLAAMAVVFNGCSSDDDEPGSGGKAAMYKVTIKQSGDYQNFIKAVVIVANGTTLKDDIANISLSKTVFGDEDLTGSTFSVSTEGKAVQFAVSGGVADRDEESITNPMTWEVTVFRDGKEIDHQVLTFEDGHQPNSKDLNLYFD